MQLCRASESTPSEPVSNAMASFPIANAALASMDMAAAASLELEEFDMCAI